MAFGLLWFAEVRELRVTIFETTEEEAWAETTSDLELINDNGKEVVAYQPLQIPSPNKCSTGCQQGCCLGPGLVIKQHQLYFYASEQPSNYVMLKLIFILSTWHHQPSAPTPNELCLLPIVFDVSLLGPPFPFDELHCLLWASPLRDPILRRCPKLVWHLMLECLPDI